MAFPKQGALGSNRKTCPTLSQKYRPNPGEETFLIAHLKRQKVFARGSGSITVNTDISPGKRGELPGLPEKRVSYYPGNCWPSLTSPPHTWVQFPAAQPLVPVKSKPMQPLTSKISNREISAVVTSWAVQVSFSKKPICHTEASVAKNLLLTTTKLLQIFTGVTTSIYILGGTEKVDFRNCYFQC